MGDLDPTYEQIAEIQQQRSEYQLRKFVIGQHPSPEMQYYQACLELQDMEYKLALASLTRERTLLEIERLRKEGIGDPVKRIDADIKELELQQHQLAVIGAQREVAVLRRILSEMPRYTRAQIERAQPEYWKRRLSVEPRLLQLGEHQWAPRVDVATLAIDGPGSSQDGEPPEDQPGALGDGTAGHGRGGEA